MTVAGTSISVATTALGIPAAVIEADSTEIVLHHYMLMVVLLVRNKPLGKLCATAEEQESKLVRKRMTGEKFDSLGALNETYIRSGSKGLIF